MTSTRTRRIVTSLPTLAQMNHSELSHMAGAVDDSTINIVEVIIIIIITPVDLAKAAQMIVASRGHFRKSWSLNWTMMAVFLDRKKN